MFSKFGYKSFVTLFRIVKFWGAGPWNVASPMPYITPFTKIRDKLLYYTCMLLQLLSTAYCFIRYIQGIRNGTITGIGDGATHTFILAGYGAPALLNIFTNYYKNEMAIHFNRILVIHQKLCKWHFIKNHKINLVEVAFILLTPFVLSQSIFLAAYNVTHPNKPWFIGSFLTEMGVPVIARIPFIIIESLLYFNRWFSSVCPWVIVSISGFTCENWIMALGPKPMTSIMTTKDSLRHPTVLRPVYRTLQMINNEFLTLFSTLLIPLTLYGAIGIGIVVGYVCIKGYGVLPFTIYMIYVVLMGFFYCAWFLIAPEAEQMAKWSNIFVTSLKQNSRKDLFMRRFANSCSPLRIDIGPFDTVCEGFTMDYFNGFQQQLINVILTY